RAFMSQRVSHFKQCLVSADSSVRAEIWSKFRHRAHLGSQGARFSHCDRKATKSFNLIFLVLDSEQKLPRTAEVRKQLVGTSSAGTSLYRSPIMICDGSWLGKQIRRIAAKRPLRKGVETLYSSHS